MIDVRTVLYCLGFASLIFSLLLILTGKEPSSKRLIYVLALAKLAEGLAFFLFSGRDEIPALLSKNVGNSLLFSGIALDCIAAWIFFGIRRWKVFVLPILAVAVLAINVDLATGSPDAMRVVKASFFVGALMILCALGFLRGARKGSGLSLIIGLVDVFVAIVNLVRAGVAYQSPDFNLLSANFIQYVATGSFLLFAFTNGFGFLLLIKEEDGRQLTENEARYRAIFTQSTAAMLLIDTETRRIAGANSSAESFYGYDLEKMQGMPIDEIALNTGSVPSLDVRHAFSRHSLRNGELRDVEIYLNPFESGGRSYVMCLVHDITERKLAEERLAKSEENYRILTENSLQAIAAIRGNPPVVTYVNPKWAEISGYSAEETLTLGPEAIWNLVHPDHRAMMRRRYLDRISGQEVVSNYEVRFVRKDGRTGWVELFVNRIDSNDGPWFLVAAIDISERKRAEEETARVEAQYRQLEKAESLRRMAGAIAHHFNNMLGVVIGNLELALMKLNARDTDVVEEVGSAIDGACKASGLSRQMLTYLGQSIASLDPLDLSELCRENREYLEGLIAQDIELETTLQASGPVACANEGLIRMVLERLIANASEAIQRNPEASERKITLSAKAVPASEASGEYLTPADWVRPPGHLSCLEVTDTGCGIPREDLERIFDPFFTTE